MRITDNDIRKFQEIWREEFAEEIAADAARENIARLDALYLLLYRQGAPKLAPSGSEDTEHQ